MSLRPLMASRPISTTPYGNMNRRAGMAATGVRLSAAARKTLFSAGCGKYM